MIISTPLDAKQENRVVTAMVVDKQALAAIAEKWDPHLGLFESKWGNIVGTWAVRHYKKYKVAPLSAIEGYFDEWAAKQKDKALVKGVEKFLKTLSGDYSRLKRSSQTEYAIDAAASYFNRVKQQQLVEEAKRLLEVGDVEKVDKLFGGYHKLEMGVGTGVDVLGDAGAMKRAFEQKSEPLIKYPGAMGVFFGPSLERDGFISFEAPEKRGKTWILMDIAWMAMLQGRRVAFFEVGDLSESQALRRFAVRATKRPLEACTYTYPISLDPAGESVTTTATVEERKAEKALTYEQVQRAVKKYTGKRRGGPLLKLFTYPMSSINVTGMEAVLAHQERDGWVWDVLVTDYADILAPLDGKAEGRDQVNGTWKGLRRLSQQYHGLCVTATQTDADSYDTDIIDMSNFSEDKRKRAHVTGSIGINQTDAEKEMGITRFNWIVRREWAFSKRKCVHVAGCLSLARPVIHSTF